MEPEDAADEPLVALREENGALERERDRLRDVLGAMASVAAGGCADDDSVSLLERLVDQAMLGTGASDASVLVPDPRTRELVFVMTRGESPQTGLVGARVPSGRGVAAWVAEHRRPAIVNDAGTDDRFYSEMDLLLQYRTRSLLAAPLIGRGELLAVVEMVNKQEGRLFSTGDQRMLTLLCHFAGDVLAERLGSEARAAAMAAPEPAPRRAAG